MNAELITRLEADLSYLEQADAHADEGPLGEAAARSILSIGLRNTRDLAEMLAAAQFMIASTGTVSYARYSDSHSRLEAAIAKVAGKQASMAVKSEQND
jgi:7-keto-8-aminopelargonate synthetase-like enzyme